MFRIAVVCRTAVLSCDSITPSSLLVFSGKKIYITAVTKSVLHFSKFPAEIQKEVAEYVAQMRSCCTFLYFAFWHRTPVRVSERSLFEYGQVNHALCAAMKNIIRVSDVVGLQWIHTWFGVMCILNEWFQAFLFAIQSNVLVCEQSGRWHDSLPPDITASGCFWSLVWACSAVARRYSTSNRFTSSCSNITFKCIEELVCCISEYNQRNRSNLRVLLESYQRTK